MSAEARKGGRGMQFRTVFAVALALVVTLATPSGSVRAVSCVQTGNFVVVVSNRTSLLIWAGKAVSSVPTKVKILVVGMVRVPPILVK